MQLKNHLLIFVTLILFVVGCGTPKPTIQTTVSKTDSTSTKVTYQKQTDTFTVAADSVKINVPIAALSSTPIIATSTTGRSKASVKRVNNNVEVECFVDEYQRIIEYQNTLIETLIQRFEKQHTTETKTEYKTHWLVKGLATLGGIAMVVLVGGFAFKRYLKPI